MIFAIFVIILCHKLSLHASILLYHNDNLNTMRICVFIYLKYRLSYL